MDTLNIGGGFPIKNKLAFEYDYEYMAEEIVSQIKQVCEENGIPEPDIFTEFGSFTVGESGRNYFLSFRPKGTKRQGKMEHDRLKLHDSIARRLGY